jgi:hypothetical protein
MAGNARFHDKHHRTNHHTLSTAGIPDSATDPIASPSQPFQGDFVVNGLLSSSKGVDVLSANYGGDVICENIYVRETTYTNFISGEGTETIISDGALTGYGDNTLTLDFGTAIYAKTPIFNFTNSISAASAIYTNFAKFVSLSSSSISATNTITNSLSTIVLSSDKIFTNSISSISLTAQNGILNNISANTISTNSLSTTVLSSGEIFTNNLSSVSIAAQNVTSVTLSSQSLSTKDVIISNNLTVSGNCLIYGNLSALGDLTQIETILHSSSSFNITNTDITLPALKISQEGTGNIVLMEYGTVPNFLKIDRQGLSINGRLSALSGIYSDVSVDSPNITTITNTANSVNSTVSSNSANWESTYTNVSSNSANWENTYNTVSSNSANWQSVYNTVSSTSANWESVYSTVSGISANLQNTYSTVSSNSANWESTYTNVSSNSANWENTYNTVSSNSANWNNTYSTVSSTSANWQSVYSTVSSNSAHWESTESTVRSNSANWLSGSDTLSFVASSIRTDALSANVLSANIIRVYQAIHVSVSAVTVAQGTTTTMSINSPSYYFINVSSAGTAYFNLPATNGNNRGMLFYIKNVSPVNNEIVHVNNSAGTLLTNGALNGGNGHHIEVVWDGTTWQQISLS